MNKPFIHQPRLLTEEMLVKLEEFLQVGCTIEVACASVGIKRQTFYNWQRASADWCALGDAHPRMPVAPEIVPILTFLTRITRAQARSLAVATMAIYSGTVERRYVETTVREYSETRLRKNDKGEEIPYTHTETETVTQHHVIPSDWRAGVELNRRRDPNHWNPPTRVEVSFEQKAIAYIRSGEVTFEALAKGYGVERAISLFQAAGVPIPSEVDAESFAGDDV